MRLVGAVAMASCLSIVVTALLFGGAAVGAEPTPSPTPSASGAAPVTVVIPGAGASTPGPPPGNGSGGGSPGGGQPGNGPGNGGGKNPDGSPIPPGKPKSNAPDLDLDKEQAAAGDWVITTAAGYQAGEKAQVVLYPGTVVIGSYTVGAAGEFSARFRIPEGTATGAHVIEVTGWGSGYITNAELVVISAGSVSSGPMAWWIYVVLGVLLVGLVSLAVAFRSGTARSSAPTPIGGPAQ